MNLTLLYPELAVLGLALLVFLGDLFTKDGGSKRFLGWLCAAGFAGILAYVICLPAVGAKDSISAFGGMFLADGLARVFKVIFLSGGLLASLASIDYLDSKGVRWQGEYYLLLVLVTSAMMAMASAGDLLSLYVALEFNSLGFYALVSILKGRSLVSSEAGIKYLLLGSLASTLLLYGISLIYGMAGTLSMPALLTWAQTAAMTPAFSVALLLMVAGFAFKISLAPFHMWSPDVYQAAPTPITSYLSVGSKAAGFAAIIRIFPGVFQAQQALWVKLFMVLMALTFVWANVVALKQRDLKRLLAYSSVSQAGYLMIGIIAGTSMGLHAVLFYGIVYLFTNMAGFQVAQLLEAEGTGGEIAGFAGLSTRSPGLALCMMTSVLSLAGIPPFAGFFGKYYLFAAGMQEGLASNRYWLIGLVGFAVVMSIVGLFYYLIVVKQMYIEPAHSDKPVRTPLAAKLALGITCTMVLVMGIYPTPFLDWLKQALPLP
jgi:NADH-quinone oxidoreductase subunit N